MSRAIKFRAWDKEEERMWFNVQNAYDTLNNHHTPDPKVEQGSNDYLVNDSFGGVLGDPDLIVMQFTGLLDKNGKEIYEGDILKWDEEVFEVKFGEHSVEAYYCCVGFYTGDGDNAIEAVDYDGGCEVIGNIYENPEMVVKRQ